MNPYAVPDEVADRLVTAADEGRAIQGAFRRKPPGGGKELVCALAALGDDINDYTHCPAEYMPPWLAELIPTLDDGIEAEAVPAFFRDLAARARKWRVLDTAAWKRVRVGFLSACIRQALEVAEHTAPKPPPAYFIQVHNACHLVLAALRGAGDLLAALDSADDALDAAEEAENSVAACAVTTTFWAGRGKPSDAARTAAGTALIADGSVAKADAYQTLAATLFALLDEEIAKAGAQ